MNNDDPREVYADIIDLPYRKNPERKHMSLYARAAQFAPFAALSGYDDMVREESRITDTEHELSEYEADMLNRKLSVIKQLSGNDAPPEVTVTYFVPDKYKSGGEYTSITALVKAVDITQRKLILYGSDDIFDRKIDPILIDFDRIRDINGKAVDFSDD